MLCRRALTKIVDDWGPEIIGLSLLIQLLLLLDMLRMIDEVRKVTAD